MKSIENWIRPDILSFAKEEINRKKSINLDFEVCLDKNESAFITSCNRYNTEEVEKLKQEISRIYNTDFSNILLTNGSAEAIDLLLKMCCFPSSNNVIGVEPTRSIYRKLAQIQGVSYKEVYVDEDFTINASTVLRSFNNFTKIIFISNPHFSTGEGVQPEVIKEIAREFNGLVVVDYAYANFALQDTWEESFEGIKNIVLINSISRIWRAADCRIGFVVAHKELIEVLKAIQMPYTISNINAKMARSFVSDSHIKDQWKRSILPEMAKFVKAIQQLDCCKKIYKTQSDFFLVEFINCEKIYNELLQNGILVKDMRDKKGCKNCLRIAIGTKEQNNKVISVLRKLQ